MTMPAIRRPLSLAAVVPPIACAIAVSAHAAPDAPAVAPAPATHERVEITGTATGDDGRDATASRIVVSRESIARFGDSSVNDVLRRIPGITIVGTQGRASDIRMRGLGSGYTQVLVNGEPVPTGFSLESLPPSQIERIEISRVAAVDVSAQAIAGTINIILRQSMRKGQREVKAGASSQSGRGSITLDGNVSDRLEAWSYSLGAGLSRKNEAWPATITQQGFDVAGAPELDRVTRRRAFGLSDSISLTPKLGWQFGDSDKLSVEALLRHTRFSDDNNDQREVLLGALPPYLTQGQTLDLRTTLAQMRLNWTHTLEGGATLDTRLGTNLLRRASESHFLGEDERQALALRQHVTSNTSERGFTAAGKFRLPYSEKHAVALGWDGEQSERDDTRSQRQSSPIGRPVADLDESYQSVVQRLALYAQDEWDIDDRLSAYVGVRWAMLRTRTAGANLPEVGNRSGVASPVLQVLWKPAAAGGDQFRFALSRTYKAPRTADLSPRRFVAFDNTATTPDLQGNPDLRPELAWGLDLAYEHALADRAGELNLNLTARRIEDVILDRLSFENGAWMSRKANQGFARVYGLELDSRWRLRATWPDAPDAELRAGVSRNWSTVDAIPGPDNRLDSQVPWSANLGIDWRAKDLPLTFGGSIAYKGSVKARTSLTQSTTSNAMTTLDLYALWKFTPAVQLRAAVSNALRPHDVTTDSFTDGTGRLRQTTDAPSAATVRLGFEIRL